MSKDPASAGFSIHGGGSLPVCFFLCVTPPWRSLPDPAPIRHTPPSWEIPPMWGKHTPIRRTPPIMGNTPGRNTTSWIRLRDRLRREAQKRNDPCWICGGRIDYLLPPGSPNGWEPDHVISPLDRPDLAEDATNIRSAHVSCNRRRGRNGVTGLGTRQRRI